MRHVFVLYTGIPWEFLPKEFGFGPGMTCWRRLRDWNDAGVWTRLHENLPAELHAAGARVAEQATCAAALAPAAVHPLGIRGDIHEVFLRLAGSIIYFRPRTEDPRIVHRGDLPKVRLA